MVKKDLIQIRVTNEQKKLIKKASIDADMTISEFVLYAVDKVRVEDEMLKKYYGQKEHDIND